MPVAATIMPVLLPGAYHTGNTEGPALFTALYVLRDSLPQLFPLEDLPPRQLVHVVVD